MLVVVSIVRRVPVPVVQIVQVVVVGDGAVAAPFAMDVIVPGGVVRPMPLVACHEAVLSGEDVDESALVSSGCGATAGRAGHDHICDNDAGASSQRGERANHQYDRGAPVPWATGPAFGDGVGPMACLPCQDESGCPS